MTELPVRVLCLSAGHRTPEQHAAYEWCGEVATADLASVAEVDADRLAAADVVWWHRDYPLDEYPDGRRRRDDDGASKGPTEAGLAHAGRERGSERSVPVEATAGDLDPIRQYLDDGGTLLLSLHAMAAVESLGVDPVPPDAVGYDEPTDAAGPLVRSLHADHPLFETFDEPTVPTRAPGDEHPFARYEYVHPSEGEVLASEFRGRDYLVGFKPVVEWQVGDDAGRVLGLGSGIRFIHAGNFEAAANQERLVQNALVTLAGDRRSAGATRPRDGESFRRLRRRLSDDHHRPAYHFSPPANWLNDPNGMIHWDGRYHVFYQYNPGGPFHNAIHWGHAVSEDLLHWRDLPLGLSPDPEGPDRDGCWSGCAVDDDGTPTILYTGGNGRTQLPCLATTDDPLLRSWDKHAGNPVIESAPADLDVLETEDWEAEFRDHNVWREDGTWYHVIGSGIADVGGTALLYRGETLDDWEYVGELLTADREDAGAVWECPELLRYENGDVLHVSPYDSVEYFLGEADLETGDFDVEDHGILDYGDYYAPQSMQDDDGRYVTLGWLPEARGIEHQWEAGWSGLLSLPRVIDVDEDGDLRQRPVAEVTALRDHQDHDDETHHLAAGERHALDPADNAYELAFDVDVEDGATFSLVVCESPARSERTEIRYDGGEVVLDREGSSLEAGVATDDQRMPVEGDTLSLRAFVDGSVVELYANERRCLTSRVYPTRADATGVALEASGGAVTVASLDCWALASTWETPTGR